MPELAGIEVQGLSIGGLETCIDFPRLGFAFDIGRCPESVVSRKTILFTHSHIDHLGGIAQHAASRALKHMPPPTYVVPRHTVEPLRALFAAWTALDGGHPAHELVPLSPGEEVPLDRRRVAVPFHAPHRGPCQGYGIWESRQKLRPEFQGRPQAELQRLVVEEGQRITEEVRTPLVAFTGDARIEVVEEEVVRTAKLLVMEVTFLDERVPPEQARSKGHIHLDEVIERADRFENEALLFTHFSSRYSRAEICAILERRLPAGLRSRVTPLLAGFH